MGQYYYPIILSADGQVLVWMSAHAYNNGLKLMEHSYIGNDFVSTFEYGLCPEGIYHKSRVVWAGDYADNEPNESHNLYQLCTEYNQINPEKQATTKYGFLVNHTKKMFVDKSKLTAQKIHPLPLLTAEGNGRGGGDYRGDSELISPQRRL